ncbi:MAG: DUF4446 family protein [Clostridia bacterium]|nr:DUF4446 family protein [Clostridia bacterium]
MNETILIAVISVLAVFVIASLIIGVLNVSKINAIMDYSEDGDLVTNLDKYYNNVRELQRKLKMSQEGVMSDRITACDRKFNLSLSKTGIVNFDAFDDVFGKQSFALAILDQYNTGFVITSLYGTNSSNTYVREIKDGKSAIPLLEEEQEAVTKAMTGRMNSDGGLNG